MGWREWRDQRRQRRAIASIRHEMAFWGHDLSAMSDEEIEAGAVRIGKVVASVGVTTAEAAERLTQFALLAGNT